VNSEIEILANPVISDKCRQWQADLSELRGKKVVEVDQKFRDMSKDQMPAMVSFRSNFATLAEAKAGLTEAIRTLRDMRHRPLSAIHAFIEKTEARMKALDFTVMKESAEAVSESRYLEIISQPEVKIFQPDKKPLEDRRRDLLNYDKPMDGSPRIP
jgi:hypothetical protein